jgi:hypothetical protein
MADIYKYNNNNNNNNGSNNRGEETQSRFYEGGEIQGILVDFAVKRAPWKKTLWWRGQGQTSDFCDWSPKTYPNVGLRSRMGVVGHNETTVHSVLHSRLTKIMLHYSYIIATRSYDLELQRGVTTLASRTSNFNDVLLPRLLDQGYDRVP